MGRTKDSIQMNQGKSETEAGRISTDTRKMPKTKGNHKYSRPMLGNQTYGSGHDRPIVGQAVDGDGR